MKKFFALVYLLAIFPLMAATTARAEDDIDCRAALVDCDANPDSKCCSKEEGNPKCVKKDGTFAKLGDSYKVDCNTCECFKNGPSRCTKMACRNAPGNDDDGIDCSRVKMDCHKNPNHKCCSGFKAGNPKCVNKDGTFAKTGDSFQPDCNTCECTKNGPGKCTKMVCPDDEEE